MAFKWARVLWLDSLVLIKELCADLICEIVMEIVMDDVVMKYYRPIKLRTPLWTWIIFILLVAGCKICLLFAVLLTRVTADLTLINILRDNYNLKYVIHIRMSVLKTAVWRRYTSNACYTHTYFPHQAFGLCDIKSFFFFLHCNGLNMDCVAVYCCGVKFSFPT